MNLEPFLTPYIKINSNWIMDIDLKSKALNFCGLGLGKDILD